MKERALLFANSTAQNADVKMETSVSIATNASGKDAKKTKLEDKKQISMCNKGRMGHKMTA